MKTESHVEIDRPIEEVFHFTTNNVASWSTTVLEDTILEDVNNCDVGTTFRCVTFDHGQRMEFLGTVIQYDPPNKSCVHLAGTKFNIVADYDFTDLGDRTRVTQSAEITGKGFLKVVFFLFGRAMQKAGSKAQESELGNLKRIMEEPESTPS